MDEGIRNFRDRFKVESETNFVLIGDFPSVSCSSCLVDEGVIPPFSSTREWTECLRSPGDLESDTKVQLSNLRCCVEHLYMDATPKATQAMVYVLSDLTRTPNEMKTPYIMGKHYYLK